MADGTPIIDGAAAAETIDTDELATRNGVDVSGVSPRIKVQRMKVVFGDDGDSRDASSAFPLPVSIASLPAGTNVVGHVVVDSVPAASVSTDSIAAAPYAEVSLAGATPYKLNSAASTNATSLKASAGKLYFLAVFNTNAAVRYVKFYNKASAPTVGTDTPVLTFPIPGNTAGGGFTLALPMPMKFSTGIAFALTTGATDADTGAVAANEIVVNLGWV